MSHSLSKTPRSLPKTSRIVSIWLPHWPIERLMRQNPDAVPPDLPLALVEKTAHGLVIVALNARAAAAGVRPGVTLADARAMLPALLSRPSEPGYDQKALLKLARWAGRYGPQRHRDGSDGLWIDTTGVAHLFGGEQAMLADIAGRLRGFGVTARVGLAGTFGAAYALARFSKTASGIAMIAPGEERARLTPCPVEALRLTPATAVLLKRLGLKRIGQLYEVPRVSLERRFATAYAVKKGSQTGSSQARAGLATAVLTRLDQALGLAPEPLHGLGAPPVLFERQTWSEPLISADALDAEITRLAERLCVTLVAQGLGARCVGLALYRSDGSVIDVEAGLSSASADAAHLMRLLREKLGAIDCGFGIDVASLEARAAERLDETQVTLDQSGAHQADLAVAALLDRLVGRIGPSHVYTLAAHASHDPERASVRVPAGFKFKPVAPPSSPPPLRPPLLITPPEPITVMAEVPEGIPHQFIWRRVPHRVVKGEGPERIEPEWWRSAAVSAAERARMRFAIQPRDYYRLEDKTGAHFWVFREGLYDASAANAAAPEVSVLGGSGPRWFMHGLSG